MHASFHSITPLSHRAAHSLCAGGCSGDGSAIRYFNAEQTNELHNKTKASRRWIVRRRVGGLCKVPLSHGQRSIICAGVKSCDRGFCHSAAWRRSASSLFHVMKRSCSSEDRRRAARRGSSDPRQTSRGPHEAHAEHRYRLSALTGSLMTVTLNHSNVVKTHTHTQLSAKARYVSAPWSDTPRIANHKHKHLSISGWNRLPGVHARFHNAPLIQCASQPGGEPVGMTTSNYRCIRLAGFDLMKWMCKKRIIILPVKRRVLLLN